MIYDSLGIIYSNGNALLSTIDTVMADTVTRIDAAIDEVNNDPTAYSLDAGTVLDNLPSVPTGYVGIAYQSGESFKFVDSTLAYRYDLTRDEFESILLNDARLSAIVSARATLDAASS